MAHAVRSAIEMDKYNTILVPIGVDFGGQPGHVPPIIEKCLCFQNQL